MAIRPFNLSARLEKLERVKQPRDRRFFMVWGADDADLAAKLAKAKAEGELLPGDRIDTRIWIHKDAPVPPSRRTALHEMARNELEIIAGGGNGVSEAPGPSLDQWTDAELSEFYANSLQSHAG